MIAGGAAGGAGADILSKGLHAVAGENPFTEEGAKDLAVSTGIGGLTGGLLGVGGRGWSKIAGRFAPTVENAESLSNRALFPREMPVGEQPVVHGEFGRVYRSVGPYTKAAPLEGGEGGAMRGAQQVRQASQNIWDENVEPVIDSYAHARRPVDDIAGKIDATVSPTDRALGSPRAATTDKLSDLYRGQTRSVRQMADRVRELNNDKAVARFQNMDANQQSQALLGDPALRGKVAELNGLRDKLFSTVAEEGGETLGAQFEEARKDWGALRTYEDRVLNAKVPTPQPLFKRMANTARSIVGLKNDPLSIGAADTLGRLDNPNRLIPKALNMAGQGELAEPPVVTQGRSTPFTPTNRMLPAAGESSPGGSPLGGVRGEPGGGPVPRAERGLSEVGEVPGGPNQRPRAIELGGIEGPGGLPARIPGRNYRTPSGPGLQMPEPGTQRALPPPGFQEGPGEVGPRVDDALRRDRLTREMLRREPGEEEAVPTGGVRTARGLILTPEEETIGRTAAPKERVGAERAEPVKSGGRAATSKEATFDSLPARDQAWINDWARDLKTLPKALQDAEMAELQQQKYGDKGTTPLRERIAKRYVEQTSQGRRAEASQETNNPRSSDSEARRAEMEQADRRRQRNTRGQRPERDY